MSSYSHIQFNDSNSLMGNEIFGFHDLTLSSLVLIFFLVVGTYYVFYPIKGFLSHSMGKASGLLEIGWTVVPGFILIMLGMPSLYVLYFIEGGQSTDLTIKAIGHQWFWSYETADFFDYSMDSYMLNDNSGFRLLEVDGILSMPYLTNIRMVMTSDDVIHAWTLPTMGIKVDAVPGRLNSIVINSFRPGSYYGQCSELCGINHSYMPIHVDFISWDSFLDKFSDVGGSE
uniref:Cytochrome c oxidase subunit 2 n=1 Tax=Rhodosoma turcicum TaxID=1256665 RepID=S0DFE8_9ASCI|nr:cytochrome c oxidase subunit II [Rhodosoma turcicum]CCO25791.1 cytochrome c oxidase subunit II [Rhodosoma turcicum]